MKKEKTFTKHIHYFPHKSFRDTHITAQVLPYTLIVSNASGRLFHKRCPFAGHTEKHRLQTIMQYVYL